MNEHPLLKKIKYVEWALVFLTGATQLYWTYFVARGRTEASTPVLFSTVLLLLFSFLACVNLANLTTRRQILHLTAQLLCLFFACTFGAFKLYSILFIVVAAKASILLSRHYMIGFVSLVAITHIIARFLSLQDLQELRLQAMQLSENALTIFQFEGQLYFLCGLIIVTMLGRKLVLEEKARRTVERLSSEVEEMAVTLERTRIARELHDSLGHTLTSLNIQLELAGRQLDGGDSEHAGESIKECKEIAARSLNEVRHAVETLRDDNFDFRQAVESLSRKVSEQVNLECRFESDADEHALSIPLRHNLFGIVKECLTNIQRHARASNVNIHFSRAAGYAVLLVQDNGIGFNSQSDMSGFGIQGMKERVESLGGRFKIDSSPGNGTTIKVEVPV